MIVKAKLFADPECWEFQKKFPDEFKSYGCGPGWFGDLLVPDTVYFLSIKDACRIHDWGVRHSVEASEEHRARNDRILLNNSIRIVDTGTYFYFLKMLRYRRCRTYYNLVRIFGGPGYWEERNPDNTIGEINV